MIDSEHSFTATITGVIAGFLVSIPVGPINLTIINEGARRGFKWALLIGLGSVLMESIYCAIALAGFAAFLGLPVVKAAMELLSFIFLLFLSWKYFSAKSIPDHMHSADVIEQKIHPRSAFMVGFVRVLGNPTVLLMWATLSATFLAHNWVDQTLDDRIGCVLGVAGGAALWFLLLAWAVSKGHGRFSPKVLLRMEHVSGAILLAAALWIGKEIVMKLHELREYRHGRHLVTAIERQGWPGGAEEACPGAAWPVPVFISWNSVRRNFFKAGAIGGNLTGQFREAAFREKAPVFGKHVEHAARQEFAHLLCPKLRPHVVPREVREANTKWARVWKWQQAFPAWLKSA